MSLWELKPTGCGSTGLRIKLTVFFHELVDVAANSAFSILHQKTETEDQDFVCSVVFSGLAPYSEQVLAVICGVIPT